MSKNSPSDFLLINIGLLRRFRVPTSNVDLLKEGAWKSYSGVWPQVDKLQKLGLITWAYTDSAEGKLGSHLKKFYILTRKGRILLALFSENEENANLLEAIDW